MDHIKRDEIQRAVTQVGMTDGLILVKDGMITTEESITYGEVNVKIQNGKIMQIDKTEKKRI
ncbi:DUF2292 domain-containing protein [Bacillus pacificus]|uniref:DUF2292 domain-containing protein n=1 Tax=Bacillus pacificus TaxID=2026187 RepID=UPI00397B8AA6